MSNTLLYPNVSGSPGGVGNTSTTREPAQAPDKPGIANELPASQRTGANASQNFDQILGKQILSSQYERPVTEPLKFSAHASARMQSRNLVMGPEQMRKLNEAVDRAAAKGLDDTLVLTKDAAFIVSVKNRTVVTAMGRENLEGNVFTNIDGAVIV